MLNVSSLLVAMEKRGEAMPISKLRAALGRPAGADVYELLAAMERRGAPMPMLKLLTALKIPSERFPMYRVTW